MLDEVETECLKRQNTSLFKACRALIRRKQYPVTYYAIHKWFLIRVKNPEQQEVRIQVDPIYYSQGSNHLNQQGLAHFHLLLAGFLHLRKVKYEWKEMPLVVKRKGTRKVTASTSSSGSDARLSVTCQEGELVDPMLEQRPVDRKSTSEDEEPPMLVPLGEVDRIGLE